MVFDIKPAVFGWRVVFYLSFIFPIILIALLLSKASDSIYTWYLVFLGIQSIGAIALIKQQLWGKWLIIGISLITLFFIIKDFNLVPTLLHQIFAFFTILILLFSFLVNSKINIPGLETIANKKKYKIFSLFLVLSLVEGIIYWAVSPYTYNYDITNYAIIFSILLFLNIFIIFLYYDLSVFSELSKTKESVLEVKQSNVPAEKEENERISTSNDSFKKASGIPSGVIGILLTFAFILFISMFYAPEGFYGIATIVIFVGSWIAIGMLILSFIIALVKSNE